MTFDMKCNTEPYYLQFFHKKMEQPTPLKLGAWGVMAYAFQNTQKDFTRFIRGKMTTLPPGVNLNQMNLYKTLVVSNLNGVISPCFPVLISILPQSLWTELWTRF